MRQEQYETQKQIFIRSELPGEPLEVTVKQKSTSYRGRLWPTMCIRWRGLHRIQFGEMDFLAVESMVSNSGPTVGVSTAWTRQPERPPTEEERAAVRANFERLMLETFGCKVIWPDTEKPGQAG